MEIPGDPEQPRLVYGQLDEGVTEQRLGLNWVELRDEEDALISMLWICSCGVQMCVGPDGEGAFTPKQRANCVAGMLVHLEVHIGEHFVRHGNFAKPKDESA